MIRPAHIGYAAASLSLLSILGALIAPSAPPAKTLALRVEPSHQATAIQSLEQKQVVGFSLNVHYTEQLPKYHRAIDMVADMGTNSLQILTPAFQVDGAATRISITNQPGRCPSADELLALLNHAHDRQLKTLLMPTILFTEPRGNEWRGKISPENWDAWWESYSVTIRHFANLAQRANVDVFCVGSELLSTERQTDRWVKLIAQIRKVYHGQLLYATNWDHYQVPGFWDHVDFVGISGYWQMTRETIDLGSDTKLRIKLTMDLADRWKPITQSLQDFARQVKKPILITELGYPCLPWGLKDPWNYVNDGKTLATPDVQAIGYQAFCDHWDHLLKPGNTFPAYGLAGVIFYTWDPYNGGLADPGYGVWGKPAQGILRRWLTHSMAQ